MVWHGRCSFEASESVSHSFWRSSRSFPDVRNSSPPTTQESLSTAPFEAVLARDGFFYALAKWKGTRAQTSAREPDPMALDWVAAVVVEVQLAVALDLKLVRDHLRPKRIGRA